MVLSDVEVDARAGMAGNRLEVRGFRRVHVTPSDDGRSTACGVEPLDDAVRHGHHLLDQRGRLTVVSPGAKVTLCRPSCSALHDTDRPQPGDAPGQARLLTRGDDLVDVLVGERGLLGQSPVGVGAHGDAGGSELLA